MAVALLLALPVRASAVDVKTVLSTLGFPDDTEAKVQDDQFVEVALPTRSDRDLNVGIAFLVRQTPEKLVANVMKEKPLLRADPSMIAYGDFHGDGALGDLAKLKLTDEQASAYASAKAGDALNLSSDEIAALKAAGGDPSGVDAVVHAQLLARYRAYRAKGLAGIAPYDRGGSTTDPAKDLDAIDRAARLNAILPASFHDLLESWPQNVPAGLAQNFYWSQFRAHDADTIALSHVFEGAFDGTEVVVQRHYYVSTGYNAEQAIIGFLAVPEGTLVVYTNHTSTDQVAGFGGGAKRSIGRKFMASQLESLFQKTRAAAGR